MVLIYRTILRGMLKIRHGRQYEEEVYSKGTTSICAISARSGAVLARCYGKYIISVQTPQQSATRYRPSLCNLQGKIRAKFRLCFRRFNDLTSLDRRYRVVPVIDVIDHVEHYIGFARAIKRHGGYVVFHIPLHLSVQSIVRATPLESARKTVGHLHNFTEETAIAASQHCGYSMLDSSYTDVQLDSPGRSLKIRLVGLSRRISFFLNEDIGVRFFGGCSLMVLAR